ncbi:MAG: hypothetical protein NXI02_33600, partial [Rhodobacteraceae bacterium]|nr:hypothetical protein [Paracoccaceae bacterium]
EFRGKLYFSARATNGDGKELHSIDAAGNVVQIADLFTSSSTGTGTQDARISGLTVINGALYFSARSNAYGHELFRVNADETLEAVTDVNSGTDSRYIGDRFEFAGDIYVAVYEPHVGDTLYRLGDGGSLELIDLDGAVSGGAGQPLVYTEFNDFLYVVTDDFKVFRVGQDGTVEYRTSVPINPARSDNLQSRDAMVYDGALYFGSGEDGERLYRMAADETISEVDIGVRLAGLRGVFGELSGPPPTDENTPVTISSIVVSDQDAGSVSFDVGLSAANGTLSLESTAGLIFSDSDGSDGTLAFSGNLSDLNNAFASGLTYTPDTGFTGDAVLSITVDDGAGGVTTENAEI